MTPRRPERIPNGNRAKSWQERIPLHHLVGEAAVVNATEALVKAMDSQGVSRGELSRRIGISQPAVTQLLRGDHALGVRTLARYAIALGLRVAVDFVPETDPQALDGYRAALRDRAKGRKRA